MNQPLLNQLSANQLATVRLCAQEESCVIEVLQEIKAIGSDAAKLKELLISELCALGQHQKLEFYLDDFASGIIKDIPLDAAYDLLKDPATWDVHNLIQLHLRWIEN